MVTLSLQLIELASVIAMLEFCVSVMFPIGASGVPASGVRFQQLGAVRGSYSFNIFEQYRLDLFLERAWGRDRTFDDTWQPITGIGAAVNLRAPWNTMLRADVGKSFLPDRYRGVGSATLQVMILKPLR